MLTVAFFGSGGAGSMVPLEALAKSHRVMAIVSPAGTRSVFRRAARSLLSRAGIGEQAAMFDWARTHDVPLLEAVSGRDPELAGGLKRLAPDTICVAAFPWILGKEILGTARLGAWNAHSSLLPRHRGPNPLLWIYYHNDRQTGVTVHRMTERADAGDIFSQEVFELPRGWSVDRLYLRKAEVGARLLVEVLNKLETGDLEGSVQDERLSTYAPRVPPSVKLVNFAEWDVERVWHFLAGLCSRRQEPLHDHQGREVHYHSVLGYTLGDCGSEVGQVRSAPFGWNLYCHGGSIQLGAAGLKR